MYLTFSQGYFILTKVKHTLHTKGVNMNRLTTGAFVAIGIGVGAALGVAMNNIVMGIGIGVAIGAAIGAFASRSNSSNQ